MIELLSKFELNFSEDAILNAWGLHLVKHAQKRIDDSQKVNLSVPLGYLGLKLARKINKKKPDPPDRYGKTALRDSGTLYNSITYRGTFKSIQLGTPIDYSYYHQEGKFQEFSDADRRAWLDKYGIRINKKKKGCTPIKREFLKIDDADMVALQNILIYVLNHQK